MANILIIDDERMLRDNLVAFLEDENHVVEASSTAESGLSKLHQFRPDAVIVDLRLEGIDGEVFVKTAYRINPQLQFILHTGSSDYQLSQELRELGLSDENLLYKPIPDLSVLGHLIERLTQQSPQAVSA